MLNSTEVMRGNDFDKPLTLGELVKKLGPDDKIIAELPNGENRYFTRYSHLDKSDAALPIAKPYKYDWLSKTFHVKISTLEMYLSPKTTELFKVEPITLSGICKDLGRNEEMIVEFPNGLTKTYHFYSDFRHLDDEQFLVQSCEYDCPSKTYHVKLLRSMYGIRHKNQKIKRIICDGPATIIFWADGTKTIVKAQEEFDYEKGILYAALKKLTTKKEYDNILRAIDKVDEARKDGC